MVQDIVYTYYITYLKQPCAYAHSQLLKKTYAHL